MFLLKPIPMVSSFPEFFSCNIVRSRVSTKNFLVKKKKFNLISVILMWCIIRVYVSLLSVIELFIDFVLILIHLFAFVNLKRNSIHLNSRTTKLHATASSSIAYWPCAVPTCCVNRNHVISYQPSANWTKWKLIISSRWPARLLELKLYAVAIRAWPNSGNVAKRTTRKNKQT